MSIFSSYVVHEHLAKIAGRHYDLRIQIPRHRLLASWALPKAHIPIHYGEKVLAIKGQDHGAYWLYFEGNIPAGQYGYGSIKILESGVLEILGWSDRFITFIGQGNIVHGRYHLTKFKPKEKNTDTWILLKGKDKEERG